MKTFGVGVCNVLLYNILYLKLVLGILLST